MTFHDKSHAISYAITKFYVYVYYDYVSMFVDNNANDVIGYQMLKNRPNFELPNVRLCRASIKTPTYS